MFRPFAIADLYCEEDPVGGCPVAIRRDREARPCWLQRIHRVPPHRRRVRESGRENVIAGGRVVTGFLG